MSLESESEYEPGVCNIGGDERWRRYAAGCFLVAGAYLAAVFAFDQPRALLVGMAVHAGR